MSDLVELQLDGVLCAECGGTTRHEYGYPVLCRDCWGRAKQSGLVRKIGGVKFVGCNQREPDDWPKDCDCCYCQQRGEE